jgi:hypothetical protein
MMQGVYSKHKPGEALAREVLGKSICIDKRTFIELKTRPLQNFTSELSRISSPTLIMGGTGLKLEERGSRNLYQHIPYATLALFENGKDPLSATCQRSHDQLMLDYLLDRTLQAYEAVTLFTNEQTNREWLVMGGGIRE